MKDAAANSFLPLAPATLHILLSLAGEDLHGYGIMQEVARQSEGRYKLGPGTLYDNLQRLMSQGLVEEAVGRVDKENPRRRNYRLSRLGRGVLAARFRGSRRGAGGEDAPQGAATEESVMMRRVYLLVLSCIRRRFASDSARSAGDL
jgi:DNA-binding PadR family transcriptional regulator